MGRTLIVNGQTHAIDADPETPLLYVLRDTLGLTAARYGCGLSECGACSVLVDGKPVRSCVLPVSAVTGRVTTLEGLAEGDALAPIQQAFIDEQAAQCGYCISGMMVVAHALLAATPDPSDAEIATALSDNLCGCGTHRRILRAVRRAARTTQTQTGRS